MIERHSAFFGSAFGLGSLFLMDICAQSFSEKDAPMLFSQASTSPLFFRAREKNEGEILQISQMDLLRDWLEKPIELRSDDVPLAFDESILSSQEADEAADLIWADLLKRSHQDRKRELRRKVIQIGRHSLRFEERVFGEMPDRGHSLWISLHGGGGTTRQINDQQWRNQARLYDLEEGIYIAPRAPTDTWNLWHQNHIDPLFSRLIDNYVLCRNVDPNRVYLLGYSAGGDGVFQLAPRMADRWAAAGAMAGHPNETKPLGLRNVGFALFVGGEDSAYKRNEVAQKWKEELSLLRNEDPDGYRHWVRIYPRTGHWMNGREREALPWMARFVRDPWASKIEWLQDDVRHDRFYWLSLPKGTARSRARVSVKVNHQNVEIDAPQLRRLNLRLSDRLLNLDQPISVFVNDKLVFEGIVKRSIRQIHRSLKERPDRESVATALLELSW